MTAMPPSTHPGDLRVSDAERTAVADALSHHYADGRLDRVELDERLDRAMSAKTRADLAGLFEGLPGPADPLVTAIPSTSGTRAAAVAAGRGAVPARGPHRGRRPALTVLLVLLVLAGVGQVLAQVHVGWLLVVLAVVLAVRWVRRR